MRCQGHRYKKRDKLIAFNPENHWPKETDWMRAFRRFYYMCYTFAIKICNTHLCIVSQDYWLNNNK